MPLSEHEQRMLDQIEQALYAEDPKFVAGVRGKHLGRPSRVRRLQGIVLFLLGIALLPIGVLWKASYLADLPIVSVIGFLCMFFGVLVAVTSLRAPKEGESGDGKQGGRKGGKRSSFSQRMEERFRGRFDDH